MRLVAPTGFVSAGKTSSCSPAVQFVGRRLLSSGQMLEAWLETTIEKPFATHGDAQYRSLEHDVVALFREEDTIIACGEGAIEHPGGRARFASALQTLALFHNASVESVAARFKASNTVRPGLQESRA
jgi:shikimate kinase